MDQDRVSSHRRRSVQKVVLRTGHRAKGFDGKVREAITMTSSLEGGNQVPTLTSAALGLWVYRGGWLADFRTT